MGYVLSVWKKNNIENRAKLSRYAIHRSWSRQFAPHFSLPSFPVIMVYFTKIMQSTIMCRWYDTVSMNIWVTSRYTTWPLLTRFKSLSAHMRNVADITNFQTQQTHLWTALLYTLSTQVIHYLIDSMHSCYYTGEGGKCY